MDEAQTVYGDLYRASDSNRTSTTTPDNMPAITIMDTQWWVDINKNFAFNAIEAKSTDELEVGKIIYTESKDGIQEPLFVSLNPAVNSFFNLTITFSFFKTRV